MSEYTVETNEHGLLIRGRIPVDDFSTLAKLWKKHGMKLMDAGIATATGAAFAIVRSQDAADAWRKELDSGASKQAAGDVEVEWLLGTDTGISSLSIFAVLSARHGYRATARLHPFGPCPPADPDDFGRCYRLLEKIPVWRKRLSEVAKEYPASAWPKLINHWERLEDLWREESPTRSCPKLYALMKQCEAPSE